MPVDAQIGHTDVISAVVDQYPVSGMVVNIAILEPHIVALDAKHHIVVNIHVPDDGAGRAGTDEDCFVTVADLDIADGDVIGRGLQVKALRR